MFNWTSKFPSRNFSFLALSHQEMQRGVFEPAESLPCFFPVWSDWHCPSLVLLKVTHLFSRPHFLFLSISSSTTPAHPSKFQTSSHHGHHSLVTQYCVHQPSLQCTPSPASVYLSNSTSFLIHFSPTDGPHYSSKWPFITEKSDIGLLAWVGFCLYPSYLVGWGRSVVDSRLDWVT